MIGWTMDQFWESSPAELALAIEAHGRRSKDNQRLLAWHACHVMSPHVERKHKSKLSVERMMGETRQDFTSPEDMERYLAKTRAV